MTLNVVAIQFRRHRRGLIWSTVVGGLLVAAGLRLSTLFASGLHSDEALFATWARLIGTWQSPMLRQEVVDKPPLLFYLQALFYPLLGTADFWVSRIPNLVASILVVPLIIRLTWLLYGDWMAAAIAGILIVFSPLLRTFSATAFTDPLVTTLLIASLVMAVSGELDCKPWASKGRERGSAVRDAFMAGLFMGLAIVTKYQAALFIPLQASLAWLRGAWQGRWRPWLLGLIAPLLALIVWGQLRGETLALVQQQMANYGGLRASWSWELWSRLEQWGSLWSETLNAPVLVFGFILVSPIFLALLIQHQDRNTAFDQLLILFLLAYVLLHWFIAVPIWPRYLLPVTPLAYVLLGRFVGRVVRFLQPTIPLKKDLLQGGVVFVITAFVALSALTGAERDARLGALETEPASAAQIAEALSGAPYGTVLYDHWYSWQLRYFLMDSRIFVSWFSHPDALVDDLDAFLHGEENRYVLVPRRPDATVLLRTLHAAGYRLIVARALPDVILYRIESR